MELWPSHIPGNEAADRKASHGATALASAPALPPPTRLAWARQALKKNLANCFKDYWAKHAPQSYKSLAIPLDPRPLEVGTIPALGFPRSSCWQLALVMVILQLIMSGSITQRHWGHAPVVNPRPPSTSSTAPRVDRPHPTHGGASQPETC